MRRWMCNGFSRRMKNKLWRRVQQRLGCHRTRKNQFSRFTIFVNKELGGMRFLLTIVFRMDTHSGYYKQNTHTAATWPDAQFRMENSHTDTNGTVYMVIWFSFCFFGRYGYLDFFTKTISRFFFAQNSLLPELG